MVVSNCLLKRDHLTDLGTDDKIILKGFVGCEDVFKLKWFKIQSNDGRLSGVCEVNESRGFIPVANFFIKWATIDFSWKTLYYGASVHAKCYLSWSSRIRFIALNFAAWKLIIEFKFDPVEQFFKHYIALHCSAEVGHLQKAFQQNKNKLLYTDLTAVASLRSLFKIGLLNGSKI